MWKTGFIEVGKKASKLKIIKRIDTKDKAQAKCSWKEHDKYFQ